MNDTQICKLVAGSTGAAGAAASRLRASCTWHDKYLSNAWLICYTRFLCTTKNQIRPVSMMVILLTISSLRFSTDLNYFATGSELDSFFFFLYLFNPESDRVPCLQIIVCTSCIYNNRLGRYRESKSFNLDLKITQLVIINDEEQQLHRNIRDNTYMLSYYYWKLESVGNNIVFLFAPAE